MERVETHPTHVWMIPMAFTPFVGKVLFVPLLPRYLDEHIGERARLHLFLLFLLFLTYARIIDKDDLPCILAHVGVIYRTHWTALSVVLSASARSRLNHS